MTLRGLPGRIFANGGVATRRIARRFALPAGQGVWLRLRLTSPLHELPTPVFFSSRDAALPLVEVLRSLEAARDDPRVDGVLVELGGGVSGFASVLPLRRALGALGAACKPVVAWGENLTGEELLLGSAASKLFCAEAGGVQLVGLRLEGYFLRDLLQRLGVAPEVVRIGSFKSAGETFTRDGLSPENREQLEALLEDRFDSLVDGIAEGRGLDVTRVRELVDRGPYGARAAAEAGLVDGWRHADEIGDELRKLGPERGCPARLMDLAAYASLSAPTNAWHPWLRDLPTLAYVVARGGVQRHGGGRGIGSDAYRRLLDALARSPRVRGVVLRVDSPGGDAIASDALWRAVSRLRREKPVVASLGEVAASGGYYLASAADQVLVEPACITGSIGVVGGKLNLEGLYERIGIGRDGVERGARAGLASETRGFTADERGALRESMESLYALFVERVATGRGLPQQAVREVGEGRVWSGARAFEHGLANALGGPLEALAEARRLAGLLAGEAHGLSLLPRIPTLPTPGAWLRGRLGGREDR